MYADNRWTNSNSTLDFNRQEFHSYFTSVEIGVSKTRFFHEPLDKETLDCLMLKNTS